jgi:hypothetical protein
MAVPFQSSVGDGRGMAAYCWDTAVERHSVQYAFSGTFVALLRGDLFVACNIEIVVAEIENDQYDFRIKRLRLTSEETRSTLSL